MQHVFLLCRAHALLALVQQARLHRPVAAFAKHCQTESVETLHTRSPQTANRPQSHTRTDEHHCAHKNKTLTPDDSLRNETIWLHQRPRMIQSEAGTTRGNAWSFFGIKYIYPSAAPVAGSSLFSIVAVIQAVQTIKHQSILAVWKDSVESFLAKSLSVLSLVFMCMVIFNSRGL